MISRGLCLGSLLKVGLIWDKNYFSYYTKAGKDACLFNGDLVFKKYFNSFLSLWITWQTCQIVFSFIFFATKKERKDKI